MRTEPALSVGAISDACMEDPSSLTARGHVETSRGASDRSQVSIIVIDEVSRGGSVRALALPPSLEEGS
jgi:hypothetical protein